MLSNYKLYHITIITEHDTFETSKRIESDTTPKSGAKTKKSGEKVMKGKEYVPFQYYATTGEADDEPSQLESESSNTTWDQKMEEVHSNPQKLAANSRPTIFRLIYD